MLSVEGLSGLGLRPVWNSHHRGLRSANFPDLRGLLRHNFGMKRRTYLPTYLPVRPPAAGPTYLPTCVAAGGETLPTYLPARRYK